MASAIITVTDGDFEDVVLNSDQPVLVVFWAVWCGPCRQLSPSLEAIAEEHDEIVVAKLDTDRNPVTSQNYGIRSIPTMIVYKGGVVVDQLVGAVPKGKIEKALSRVLA